MCLLSRLKCILCLGKKKVVLFTGDEYDYSGELDQDGNLCGHGVAIYPALLKYEGTFLNNKSHGFGKIPFLF